MENSYSTGMVCPDGYHMFGGLVGSNEGGTITSSYFDTSTSPYRVRGQNAAVYKYSSGRLLGYSWHIREMKDIYGNKIEYNYENRGDILYVKTITYAGGVRKVEFDWENKINTRFSYMSGLKTTDYRILTKIKLLYNNIEINHHKLNHEINGLVKKYYLNKIDFRNTTAIINSAHFEYEPITKGFDAQQTNWPVAGFIPRYNNIKTEIHDGRRTHTEIDTFDINGDGLPDRVHNHNTHDSSGQNGIWVQLNTGKGFEALVLWQDGKTQWVACVMCEVISESR